MIAACLAVLLQPALAADALAADELPLPSFRTPRERQAATRFETRAFRVAMPVGRPAVSSRIAFVQDFGGASIGELTLRGQVGWRSVGLAVEIAGTAGTSAQWTGAGLGNTVIDARLLFGRGSTHGFGLRGTLPTGDRDGPDGPVAWWGTVPEATLPTLGIALAYDGATGAVAWHAHAGIRSGRWWLFGAEMIDAGTSLATIQPFAERWAFVGELELLSTPSPLHVRALLRRDLGGGWEVDAGLAFPVVAMFSDPTLQILARVERRFEASPR
ncbi:MAG: hypothetical protein Q8P18_11235 [Pseudomonadota bacterium]|nr:hypothetical protein [Pseudomonadota bacterium]